jgi:hypothetical protein
MNLQNYENSAICDFQLLQSLGESWHYSRCSNKLSSSVWNTAKIHQEIEEIEKQNDSNN